MEFKIISKEDFIKNNKKPNQEAVWNSLAESWKTYVVKKIPIVDEFLKDKKGKVIDLGCGAGRNMLPNREIEYYGVDFSEEQLKQAKKYVKKNSLNAKFYKFSAGDLSEFKDNSFDYGLFIATLHCIETKEQRKKALEELYRVLKPNSQSLISVWNSNDKRFDHVSNHGEVYMSWMSDGVRYMRSYYLYDKDELIDLLKEVGFKILKFQEREIYDRFSKMNWIVKVGK